MNVKKGGMMTNVNQVAVCSLVYLFVCLLACLRVCLRFVLGLCLFVCLLFVCLFVCLLSCFFICIILLTQLLFQKRNLVAYNNPQCISGTDLLRQVCSLPP